MFSSKSFHSSFQRNRTLLRTGVAVIILVAIVSVLAVLAHLRHAAEIKAAITTKNLARTLELTIEGLIDKIDISLQASADEVGLQSSHNKPESQSIGAYLMRQQERLPEVAFLRASNERGDVIYGPTSALQANIADRDYFIRLRDEPDSGLVVSRPVVGRVTQKWVWPFARRINRPDGSFDGIVFATVMLDRIEDMFSHIELGANGSVALRYADLGMMGRYPPANTINIPIGDKYLSTPFLDALKANPQEGTYISGATSIDRISRTHSYRRNAKYGFIINVGISDEAMLAEWHKQAWIISGLAAAFTLALLLFSRLIQRAWLRQERDVAALEASHQAFKANEQQLEAILNHIPDAVILIGIDGRIVKANPATFELHGISPDKPLSKLDEFFQFYECAYPDGRAMETEAWPVVRALKGEVVTGFEIAVTRKDIAKNWIALYWAVPIHYQGQLQALVGIQDITERKRAEEASRIAALVYHHSSEAMMVTNAANNIVAINDAYTRLTGYSEDEVLGKNPNILKSGLQSADFYRAMWQTLETTGYWQGELSERAKNDEIIVVRLTINTVYGASGKVDQRVALFSDITEKKRTETLIWEQAHFDTLTKLPNRRMFGKRLQQHIEQAKRDGTALGLLLIDLDQFKEVNDALGHDIGDILLIEVAHRIAACLRESMMLARLGGDEFTIILSEPDDLKNTGPIAKKIIATLTAPFYLGVEKIFLSASIGIAQFPEAGVELGDLLRHADQAMSAAKNVGRNRYAYFSSDLKEEAQLRMRLTSDLHTALAESQFEVYYQPIIELATGSIRKAEALIRWQHPTRGMVSPVEFIPLAEASGLILEIGEWVFKKSAEQVQRLREISHPAFQISVNISPVQFRNDDSLNDTWLSHLAALGLPAQSMVIEITEGLLLDLTSEVKDKLHALGEAGIQVALDDFGTGYSSLAYLKKFDIDYLKIDRAFVSNLETDSDNRALCEAIIIMAHKLGLKVIAEGIETAAQRDLLAAAGCDFAQGYLFSKPVPAAQFEALLRLA